MNNRNFAQSRKPVWKDCVASIRKMQPPERNQITRMGSRLALPLLAWTLLLSAGITHSTQATALAQTGISAGEEDGYLLGPGDRIRVDFFNVPEISGEYQVLPNGTVNFPQVGAVALQGKTLKQASRAVSAKFSAILQRPTVTISLLAARPVTIAIAGEVNRPGSYTISAGTAPTGATTETTTVPNLTRVLQLADGTTQAADLRKVQIRRIRPGGNGATDLINVDAWRLVTTGDSSQDVRLRDGDSIFIPASTTVDLREARQLAATNIAAKNNRPIKISVVGEVNRPGPYTLIEGPQTAEEQQVTPESRVPSVTKAIQVAGGITQTADIRNIEIRRLTRSGPEQVIKVNFWELLNSGDALQDLPLQDGDTIKIPTALALNEKETTALASASFSPDKILVNVVGEVERPGSVTVQPNAPLNQALLAAGGFNKRARKGSVTLIRLNPNGTVAKRDIPIDFAQGVNVENNPALRNNDVLVVRKTAIAGIGDTLSTIVSPFSSFFGLFRLLGL